MKKVVLWFALGACIFAGCNNKPENIEQDEYQVAVSFSAASSLLKATPGTLVENAVNKLKIYGVDASGKVYTSFAVVTSPTIPGTVALTVNRNVKSLYAIANSDAAMDAVVAGADVTDLTNLVAGYAAMPGSPFLMSGMTNISNYSSIAIELVRVVAKVQITSADFAISSVTVKDTPDEGYVFKQATLSIPATAGAVNYGPITTTAPMLYVAENIAAATPKTTTFEVTGTFEGKTATYEITLKDKASGAALDIVRNTLYKVNVEPQTQYSCNITVTIADWDDVETQDHTIPDSDFY